MAISIAEVAVKDAFLAANAPAFVFIEVMFVYPFKFMFKGNNGHGFFLFSKI
jgi:hypothetical protein